MKYILLPPTLLALLLTGCMGRGQIRTGNTASIQTEKSAEPSAASDTPAVNQPKTPLLMDEEGNLNTETVKIAVEYFAGKFGSELLEPNPFYWGFHPSPYEEKSVSSEAFIMVKNYLDKNMTEQRTIALLEKALPTISDYLPAEMIYYGGLGRLMLQMRAAYIDLTDVPEGEPTKMELLYYVMKEKESEEDQYWSRNYPYVEPFVDFYVPKLYFTSNEGELEETRLAWVYTFWARRWAEGTSERLYDMLVELMEQKEEFIPGPH